MTTIDHDRQALRDGLLESRALIEQGDPEKANAINASLADITSRWHRSDRLAELVSPLLASSEHPWVRYGAASSLLSNGHADLAVPVLEDLRQSDRTLAGLGAERVLKMWRLV